MPEKVAPGPVHDAHCIREAVCIDTKKIFDSCKEEDMALPILFPVQAGNDNIHLEKPIIYITI